MMPGIEDEILITALREDIGSGDITSSCLIPEGQAGRASLRAKADFVLAGMPIAEKVFLLADSAITFRPLKRDGSRIKKGTVLAKIRGHATGILMAERTALNLLQRMSGIATLTAEYVKSIRGLSARITDTRKTAPGLRQFDKYAVKVGGGFNHRFGLFDGILIKDNHINPAGGIRQAIKKAREKAHHLLKIEVEVKNLMEAREAVAAGADVIMLDNMHPDAMRKAAGLIRSRNDRILVEASGSISLDNVRKIAETGVDIISVGALTHSAGAADISLTFD